jgi:hypothetical protein
VVADGGGEQAGTGATGGDHVTGVVERAALQREAPAADAGVEVVAQRDEPVDPGVEAGTPVP